MNWPSLIEPSPLLIPVMLLFVYFWGSFKARRWPNMEKCVEIIAYGAGGIAAFLMLSKAFIVYGEVPGDSWAYLAGGVVTGLASVKGTTSVLLGIRPKYKAKATAIKDEEE